MKKIFSILLIIATLLTLTTPTYASAEAKRQFSSDEKTYVYNDDRIVVWLYYEADNEEILPTPNVRAVSGSAITGTFTYPNYDSKTLGSWVLQWTFTPDNIEYSPISGTYKAFTIMRTAGTIAEDENAIPSFMSPSITLKKGTYYTPQLLDKIPESEFVWKSNNTSVVKVNKKTGMLVAKGEGEAVVTCVVTTPYDDVYTLAMTVTVTSNVGLRSASQPVSMKKGEKQFISASYDPAVSSVTYRSSDKSVVQVDTYTGKMTAKKPGTAYITCTIMNTDYEVETQRYDVIVTE